MTAIREQTARKPRKETLKEQLARETERRKRLQLGLQDLRAYAMSPKFTGGNPMMNQSDVLLRVNETLDYAQEMSWPLPKDGGGDHGA